MLTSFRFLCFFGLALALRGADGRDHITPIREARETLTAGRSGAELHYKFRATVSLGTGTPTFGGNFYAEDATGGVYVIPGSTISVKPGDLMELEGNLRRNVQHAEIEFHADSVTKVRSGVPIVARKTTVESALYGILDGELLSITGEVLAVEDGDVLDRLLIGTDAVGISVYSRHPSRKPLLKKVKRGSIVKISGVSSHSTRGSYLVNTVPSDLFILREPVRKTDLKVVAYFGSAIAALATVVWIFALRRNVGRQTREIRSLLAQVKESEQTYRLLFEDNPHAMWVCHRDSMRFLAVNDSAVRLYGFSRREFLEMSLADIRPENETFRLSDARTETEFSGAAQEMMHRTKAGTAFPVEVTTNTITFGTETHARLTLAVDLTKRRVAERERTSALNAIQTILRASPIALCAVDRNGKVQFSNEAAENAGLVCVNGATDATLTARGTEVVSTLLSQCSAGAIARDVELQAEQSLNLWAASLRDGENELDGIVISAVDISERKRAAVAERDRARVFEKLIAREPIHSVLDTVCEMIQAQLPGCDCTIEIGDNAADEGTHKSTRSFLISSEPRAILRVNADGQWDPDPIEIGLIERSRSLCSVALEHHAMYEKLRHQVGHDLLTGLPNRALLVDRADQAIARATRDGRTVALLYIDLDRFKEVNDSMGHGTGDLFLRAIGNSMKKCLRATDTLARIGGDEFVAVIADLDDALVAGQVAETLLQAVKGPFPLNGQETAGSATIGISLFPGDGETVAELQKNADHAMYRAKRAGRGHYRFFSADPGRVSDDVSQMELSLLNALERGQFELHYQPQYTTRGELRTFEALLRFRHPKLGLVPAQHFIPLAEESGLIVPIGSWVVKEACRQAAVWREEGLAPVRVAVNVSALQFAKSDFAGTVSEALRSTGLPATCLELELTESLIISGIHEAPRQLERLRDLGVTLSIDDFGTGYSSLSYLRELPVHRVKIDQSFIREIHRDPSAVGVVQAILTIANTLGLEVVAEGVEKYEQQKILVELGCHLMQGFLFSRPVPAEEACRLLRLAPTGPFMEFEGAEQGVLQLARMLS